MCECVCVCSIVPLEADPSEGKAVSGDSVTIMLAVAVAIVRGQQQ